MIPFLNISKRMKTYVHTKTFTYSAALFITAEIGNTQMLINWWMDRWTMVYRNNRILFSNINEWIINASTWMRLKYYANLKTPEQKTTYFMSHFCRERSGVFLGVGIRLRIDWIQIGTRDHNGWFEHFKICGCEWWLYTCINLLQPIELYILKWVDFMVHKL